MIQGTAPNKAQNGVFLTAEKPPGGGGGGLEEEGSRISE